MIDVRLIEIARDDFAVRFGKRRQINAGAEPDFKRPARLFARAFPNFCDYPVAPGAMEPSPRWITRIVERLQQREQFRFGTDRP